MLKVRLRHLIDFHKGTTIIFVLLLMVMFKKTHDVTSILYSVCHGTYGILWCVKSYYFPDKSWEKSVNLNTGMAVSFFLTLFWMFPLLMMYSNTTHPPWRLGLILSIYIIGIFLHFCSDMQKYISLQLKPGHLITTGLFSYCRNPNYLGELFIYLSFVCFSGHILSVFILVLTVYFIWIPNMIAKDKSLSRYPEYKEWKYNTGILFPKRLF